VATRAEDPMALRAPVAGTAPVVENGKTVDLVPAAIPDRPVVVDVLLSETRTVRPTVHFASARNGA
jgi:hypothetical protein